MWSPFHCTAQTRGTAPRAVPRRTRTGGVLGTVAARITTGTAASAPGTLAQPSRRRRTYRPITNPVRIRVVGAERRSRPVRPRVSTVSMPARRRPMAIPAPVSSGKRPNPVTTASVARRPRSLPASRAPAVARLSRTPAPTSVRSSTAFAASTTPADAAPTARNRGWLVNRRRTSRTARTLMANVRTYTPVSARRSTAAPSSAPAAAARQDRSVSRATRMPSRARAAAGACSQASVAYTASGEASPTSQNARSPRAPRCRASPRAASAATTPPATERRTTPSGPAKDHSPAVAMAKGTLVAWIQPEPAGRELTSGWKVPAGSRSSAQ